MYTLSEVLPIPGQMANVKSSEVQLMVMNMNNEIKITWQCENKFWEELNMHTFLQML
jgi:hypothetical protein